MLKLKNLLITSAFVSGSFLIAACPQSSPGANSELDNAKLAFVETTPTPKPKVEPAITIAAGGDIMLGSPFPNATRMPANDGRDLLKPVTSIFKAADIAFANLEGPLADGGVSPKCGTGRPRCFAFRMPTRYANHLKAAGFDVMSVANNHALDFGNKGRRTTRLALDKMGIKHAGSNRGKFSTAYLEVKGKKVAFIGFAHNSVSLNVNHLAAARRAVRQADQTADIVVVSFHGGAEGPKAQRVPNKTEIFLTEKRGNLPLFSRTVIDAGADLVLGHGPHVLRGMEIYKDRLIAYSLGNFVTYGWFRLEGATSETLVLEVGLDNDGKFVGGKINPFTLTYPGILSPDKTKSAIFTLRRLSQLDFPGSAPEISDEGEISIR